MIVELHILQSFAPSNLNRDDTNSPKECQFGGYRRARISSQCIKRAIRKHFNDGSMASLISLEFTAKRTKLLLGELVKRLTGSSKSEEEAKKAASEAIKAMGLGLKEGDKTEYLLFVGEKETEAIASVVLAHWQELTVNKTDEKKLKLIGDELKSKLDGGKAVDLALFGRMLADLPDKNIDAACQVAHAISTHKVGVEFDFYTALDDLQPKEETGAGMMGDIEFNSACYYRYANIDLEQLKDNLGGDGELARKAAEAFIRASIAAVPTGKQTSFAAQNPPDFLMAVVRDAGSWSLANAFSKPVKEGGDLIGDSIAALVDYWNKLNEFYGDVSIKAKPAWALNGDELKGAEKVTSFKDLVGKVNQAIAGDP